MDTTSGNAKRSVVRTNSTDRALGRFVKIPLPLPATPSTSDLGADLFQSIWKRNPEVVDAEKVNPMRGVNRAILEQFMSENGFEETRSTVFSKLAAAISCTQTTWAALTRDDYLKSAIQEQEKADQKEQEAERKEQEADNLEQSAEEHQQQAKDAERSGNDTLADQHQQDADAESKRAQELRQQAQQLKQQAEQQAIAAAAKMQDRLDKPMGKAAMASAAKEGQKEAEEVAQFMSGWGLDGNDINATEALDLLDFKRSASQLADLVGRFKGVAKRQIEHVRQHNTGSVSEPDYTKDIMHLFPSEMIKIMPETDDIIRVPAINSLFVGGGLLGWKPKITGETGGDMEVVVDCSPSMRWGSDPCPYIVAQSIAIGCALAAKEEVHRHFELAYFNDAPPSQHPVVSDRSNWQEMMRWTRHGTSGGTRFSEALQWCIERLMDLRAHDQVGRDILFLTDEDSYISDDVFAAFQEFKAETGCRLHVVSIGCDNDGNERLRQLADTHITTMGIADEAGKITEIVIDKIARSSFGLD